MADPVIVIVDDEPQVRNAGERDLRQRYAAGYRIIKAGSGTEALDAVRQLKERNDAVALFLVDQIMPGMTGTEFLATPGWASDWAWISATILSSRNTKGN